MYQIIRYFPLIALTFLFSMIFPAFSQTSHNTEETTIATSLPRFEKVYVDPSSVLLTQEGVFFLTQDGRLQPARLVAVDTQGMYVIRKSYQCPICRRRYPDNVCLTPTCPNKGNPCE